MNGETEIEAIEATPTREEISERIGEKERDVALERQAQVAEGRGSRVEGGQGPESEPSNAEKLAQRLDRLEDMYFRPFAYETKIAQWEVKELKQHRPWLWKEGEVPSSKFQVPNANSAMPGSISSNREMADFLHEYFRERITISITKERIGKWLKGREVGFVFIDGVKTKVPNFPKPDLNGRRWTPQIAIDWVERWLVPQFAVGIGLPEGGTGAVADFDRAKQEHELWKMRREKDVADGKFKSVDVFNNHVICLGAAVNRALNDSEKELEKAMLERVQSPTANVQSELQEAIRGAVRKAMDALREAVSREVLKAKETVGLVASADGAD